MNIQRKKILVALFLVFTFSLLLVSSGKAVVGGSCTVNTDCENGEVCVSSLCAIQSGYILWYDFEGSGMLDKSSYNNNGILPTYDDVYVPVLQPSGGISSSQTIFFDGMDYFGIPKDSEFSTTVGTVSFWIKPDSSATVNNAQIIQYRSTSFTNYILFRYDYANKRILVLSEVNDRATLNVNTLTNSVPVNVWTHVAITQVRTGIKIYLNGQNADTRASLNSSDWFNVHSPPVKDFKVGHWGDWNNGFKGALDNLKITNVARTATDINEEYGIANADGDTLVNSADNCPLVGNEDQVDTDNDGVGDACDTCFDTDQDNYGVTVMTGCVGSTSDSDCNDNNNLINPGTAEVCGNEVDENCVSTDNECTETSCADTSDNDGDGLSDCSDSDCFGSSCSEVCTGGFDEDGDGRIDDADENCNACVDVVCGTDAFCSEGSCVCNVNYVGDSSAGGICYSVDVIGDNDGFNLNDVYEVVKRVLTRSIDLSIDYNNDGTVNIIDLVKMIRGMQP